AIVQPERVRSTLARAIPEFASGESTLQGCEIRRVRIKKDRWAGIYQLTTGGQSERQQSVVQTQGTFFPPTAGDPRAATDEPAKPFGSDNWRCYLPELRLLLEMQPPEGALPALPILTDPEQARAILER